MPPASVLTDATVIRIGQLVGASEVVVGTLQLEGDAWSCTRAHRARDRPHQPRRDRARTGVGDVRDVRSGRAQCSDVRDHPPSRPAHPPMAAFENYIKGLLAETPATAVATWTRVDGAADLRSRAPGALGRATRSQGDHAGRCRPCRRSRRTRRGRAAPGFLPGFPCSSQSKRRGVHGLQGARGRAADGGDAEQPRRRPDPARSAPQPVPPTVLLQQGGRADRDEPDYFFNLGYAYWLTRDRTAAIYWLREAVRRNPADGEAHFILGTALGAGGQHDRGLARADLARRLSSMYEAMGEAAGADAVPKGLERDQGRRRAAARPTARNGHRDQRAARPAELARFYLDRGPAPVPAGERPRGHRELNRAIFLSPYEAEAHLLVGRIHLRNDRVREAIDAFKISLWSAETAGRTRRWAQAYLQAKDIGRGPRRSRRGRSRSIPSSAEASSFSAESTAR